MILTDCMFLPWLTLVNLGGGFSSEEPSEYNDDEQERPQFFTLDGVVAGGNFSRYELKFGKPMRIVLESVEGDADIYFSYRDQAVSYELSKHDASSTTCGLDYIDVSSSHHLCTWEYTDILLEMSPCIVC
ncbi:hypothetical protein KIN20_001240 [Parelaphostrongylus tenuis]|uniref:Uncharacterized protein n=1 Tax=Parelaphostrongylus tenuis TaxID=148309 RepID=A0AAD5MEN4_PARTN|nr:hypothetical protein KIN20_001240 [Parelaphostrongylus tenuis]